ncbi:hypothetical protein [Burkholderia cepacia]|uniref:hypothetical protein n=1 Tax=Burkholderia cepacia TaxID=292 RepID=UPI0012D3BC2F|nr:hypothetical protein [Burkholderia cepacia]
MHNKKSLQWIREPNARLLLLDVHSRAREQYATGPQGGWGYYRHFPIGSISDAIAHRLNPVVGARAHSVALPISAADIRAQRRQD